MTSVSNCNVDSSGMISITSATVAEVSSENDCVAIIIVGLVTRGAVFTSVETSRRARFMSVSVLLARTMRPLSSLSCAVFVAECRADVRN
jgi:hypothetical protein